MTVTLLSHLTLKDSRGPRYVHIHCDEYLTKLTQVYHVYSRAGESIEVNPKMWCSNVHVYWYSNDCMCYKFKGFIRTYIRTLMVIILFVTCSGWDCNQSITTVHLHAYIL